MNKEQKKSDEKVLAALEAEYKHVRCLVDSVRTTITDLDFENMVPDADERFLMGGQLHAYEAVQDNLRNRIRFYRNRVKANKPEPWEEDSTHHCGQDTGECKVSCGNLEATVPCKNLLGMQVVGAGGSKTRYVGCPQETESCFKVELAGGDYICLAKPEKPNVISFDDEEQEGLGDIMKRIKEDTEVFMDYLDKVVINPQEQ